MNAARLLEHYERIADAPDAIARLRRFILDLAVRGKLVPQDATDEPASELLKRIAKEKARLVKAGEIRKPPTLESITDAEALYKLPRTWAWVRVGDIFDYDAGTKRDPKELDQSRWLLELEDIEKDTSRIVERLRVSDRDSQSTKSEFEPGDILYGKLRPYLNKVVVADEPGYSTTEIVAIRPFLRLCPEYCALAFRRPDFVAYVERLGRGTKMPRLRTPDAIVAPFPLPPLAEQHRIVANVDELMGLCNRLEAARAGREAARDRLTAASLARLNAPDTESFQADARFALEALPALITRPDQIKRLRQTILNLAVRGKLVPQDPNDEPASELIKRIAKERADLIRKKEIRREGALDPIQPAEMPFDVPTSWGWSRIGEAVLFTQYGTSQKSNPSEKGVPVLTMGNVQDGLVVWNNEKRIPETSEDLPALFLREFDILYNRTNSAELVGKTGIYLGEDGVRTFASYLIRIRPSLLSSNPRFLNMAMNTPEFRETQIVPLIKKQTGQANVNGTALKNMLVPLPPLAEQHRIVAKVDALMALCDRLGTSLTATTATRRRLLDALLAEALAPADDRELEAAE
jgi:type I restriction enzyme S subunit